MTDEGGGMLTGEREAREAALDNAVHSLRMEGIELDVHSVPEFRAIIDGTMSIDAAADAIASRYRTRSVRDEAGDP